jgi:osmoprotectant transport system ATP-binding protein
MAMPTPMIQLRHLTKRYGGTSVAVNDLSLEVEQGEVLVLLGASGSGKTTTLKMINRLVEPTSGSVMLEGRSTAELEPHLLRRRIGYVFQQIGLFPHMTVAENISITPSLLGWDEERIRARVDQLLRLVELDPPETMRDRRPSQLSGGQQQRVAVARALAAEPSVMLLDEPFGALDPLTRDRLRESFVRIRKEIELTCVFVTHDIVEALTLGDRIAVMRDGRTIQVGTPDQLLGASDGDTGHPYVAELMGTLDRQAEIIQRWRRQEPEGEA